LPSSIQNRLVPLASQIGTPIIDLAREEAAVFNQGIFFSRYMMAGARPRIIFGSVHESRSNGIVFYVADLLENASVIQHAREEPPLPEVAGHPLLAVKVLRISHVEGVKTAGERPLGFGDTDKVDVIGHQAEGPDLKEKTGDVFSKPRKVATEIGIFLEDGLLVVPPLGDLMGVTDDGGAG
jgi:hypothetical protein